MIMSQRECVKCGHIWTPANKWSESCPNCEIRPLISEAPECGCSCHLVGQAYFHIKPCCDQAVEPVPPLSPEGQRADTCDIGNMSFGEFKTECERQGIETPPFLLWAVIATIAKRSQPEPLPNPLSPQEEPLHPDPYVSSSGQRYRNPAPEAKSFACGPLKAGDWTLDEWRAAELLVFDTRSTYPPDSLSAIYKDIATHLQAKLNRLAALDSKEEQATKCGICGRPLLNGLCREFGELHAKPKAEEQDGEQEPWKSDPETEEDRHLAARLNLEFNGSEYDASVRFSRDAVHARRMLLEACAISRKLSEEIVGLRNERDKLKAKSVDSLPPKIPWDMPTSDRQIYESISSKAPEGRTVLEGLFKRYADLLFESIRAMDVLRERAVKAEAERDSLSPKPDYKKEFEELAKLNRAHFCNGVIRRYPWVLCSMHRGSSYKGVVHLLYDDSEAFDALLAKDSLSPSEPTREQKFKVLDILTKVEEYALPRPSHGRSAWEIVSFVRKQADALIAELEGSPSEGTREI